MKQPIDLEGIRAREQAATPGPWEHDEFQVFAPTSQTLVAEVWSDDTEFIAHARQDVPALLDEVERLQGLLGRAVEEREYLLEQWKGFLMDTDQSCEECAHHETPECLPECEWGKLWQWRGVSEREGG